MLYNLQSVICCYVVCVIYMYMYAYICVYVCGCMYVCIYSFFPDICMCMCMCRYILILLFNLYALGNNKCNKLLSPIKAET